MSEPKTMRDVLEEIEKGEGAFSRDPHIHAVNCVENAKELAREGLTLLDSLHIIPGADVVVTPQGLEDAARAAFSHSHPHRVWDAFPEEDKARMRCAFAVGLEAAGVERVDEVVEVANESGHIQHTAHRDDAEYSYVDIEPGDILYIQRKESADDQG